MYKNYKIDFKKRVVRKRGIGGEEVGQILYILDIEPNKTNLPEHVARQGYELINGDYGNPKIRESEIYLNDSALDLSELIDQIEQSIRSGENEIKAMQNDLGRIRKMIGDHYKDKVFVKGNTAFKINGDGSFTSLGKLA